MKPKQLLILLLLLPLLGALMGRAAGPFFARANGTVRLAARIWREDTQGLTERTLESTAFRDTGRPREELFAAAERIERQFDLGTALFGAWCGLVVAMKFLGVLMSVPQRTYEPDPANCLACCRCFLSCPVERQRLKTGQN